MQLSKIFILINYNRGTAKKPEICKKNNYLLPSVDTSICCFTLEVVKSIDDGEAIISFTSTHMLQL